MGVSLLILIPLNTYFLNMFVYGKLNTLFFISNILGSIFIFNMTFSKIKWFKPYFISKYNIFSGKFRNQQEFDFSMEILFEKFLEVLQHAGYKIIHTNERTGEIFAASSISWTSWGENIYIHLKEVNEKTTVDFCSACIFQFYSWKKNERNYKNLLQEFEKSLTI